MKTTKINVSHILVQYDYEAKDILKLLKEGKSFEELARKFSKCSSATAGGLLGSFAPGRLDSVFEEEAFSLKPGELSSSPVRTRFGYHIIKRNL